jgi:CHAT domain-containing protein
VARGKTNDALRWAEYSRGRTLAEGLGLLAGSALTGDRAEPPTPNGQETARRAKATLLFYWLGERQSYLWAITPRKTSLFPLPPRAEIEAAVERYRKALVGTEDVLRSADRDGQSLYRTLVAPAQVLLAKDAKVFIIPDGNLNNLNFETLIVADPKPHYWIDDATIADASSLRVLAAPHSPHTGTPRRLLLVGDSVAPNPQYPELPKAAAQMEGVARHFPGQRQVYAREQATPSAYLNSNPEQFSHIHFVAHGTASRLSPLDSAIVLSRSSAGTDSFKLYARDIIQHRLDAELVTVSACYGAGERSYSGEGLVGLSWAFIRAGAHNVIAALWEATDTPTQQLMDRFYDELDKGASPDTALRTSKLALLHGSSFHHPFYWAPFQLYTGS